MHKDIYTGEERRAEFADSEIIHKRLRDGNARMDSLEEMITANTVLTKSTAESVARIEENTAAFVAFSNDLLTGTRILCRCARGVSWGIELARRNWGLLAFLTLAYAYFTNSEKLLDLVVKFLKP